MRSHKMETLRILLRSENQAYCWEKRIDGTCVSMLEVKKVE